MDKSQPLPIVLTPDADSSVNSSIPSPSVPHPQPGPAPVPTPQTTPPPPPASPPTPPPSTPTPKSRFSPKMIGGVLMLVLILGGIGVGLILVRQRQLIEQQAYESGTATCPLNPTDDGDIVLHFDAFLRADKSESDARFTRNVSIPAGEYKITLASYDDHSTKPGQTDQTEEKYYLRLLSGGQLVTQTNSIGDLPTDQDYLTEVVHQTLEISTDITTIEGVHPAYKDNNPQSIVAVCAQFSPLTEPEPSPSPSPSPSPEVSPSPSPSPTVSPSPSPSPSPTVSPSPSPSPSPSTSPSPTPTSISLSCNSLCQTDNECKSVNSEYICYQGRCRLEINSGSDTCQPPVGGGTPTPTPTSTPTPTPTSQPEVLPEAGIVDTSMTMLVSGIGLALIGMMALLLL